MERTKDRSLAPKLVSRGGAGGRNLCLACRHYNGKRCVKEPYEYCKITRST